jgi:tetratricopeptide (TPR) repeat protein
MKNSRFGHLSALVICAAVLAACSSAPKTAPSATPPVIKPAATELNVLMDQASASEKAGQKDVALRQYDEASKLYPASKLPWLKIAQIHYDAAHYGEAIVAAQQVTARDEKDKVAHSILSVSGLRVSTKALSDLSRQNELTGSVRKDAQELAKVLRENLGETVLVPAPVVVAPAPPVAAPRQVYPAPARPRAAAPAPRGAASAAESGGTGSPFGALK